MKNTKTSATQVVGLLQDILDRAVAGGADAVDLERVPEGLEISYFVGNTGVGRLLDTPELEAPLINLIVRRAGLRTKVTGKMTWKIQGQDRDFTVEQYDSFGEACFRLKLRRPKRAIAGNET